MSAEFPAEKLSDLPSPEQLPSQKSALKKRIESALISDRHRLRRQLAEVLSRIESGRGHLHQAQRFLRALEKSLATVAVRANALGDIQYPASLPITAERERIAEAIASQQVVIVAGETGSGKTTQLPKICAEIGRGLYGRIGHTQPRRLAARTVAARIAEELKLELGGAVGYQYRFDARCSDMTRIKVMTDGILLAEIARDRDLRQYDTLIIDEAHERSLNIDFLLGYMKRLLKKRPDLKLIITSATIDVVRFAEHFSAPVISVEGRSYTVDIQYLDPASDGGEGAESADLSSQLRAVLDRIETDDVVGRGGGPRDVLVFLPGEREIRDISRSLRGASSRWQLLPLYARLSRAEQQRVFSPSAGGSGRRIVLATNVAETSLTVPGIGYVVDTGLARISRYSTASKVQRLPVEAISQASANQRAGRCGRIAPGVCYRLYSEEDFKARVEFTEPELLRTHLASVILQMKALNLGEVDAFPFIDRPAAKQWRSGLNTLHELAAVTEAGELSAIGRQLGRLPVDPRLGRILLAAVNGHCLAEVLVIVSAMAVQDPRDVPADKRQAADQCHGRFVDKRSDFLSWLHLWRYYEVLRQQCSQSQLRKHCKREYLSYVRLREWRDLHRQLLLALKPVASVAPYALQESDRHSGDSDILERSRPQLVAADVEKIHRAMITGLAGNIGFHQPRGDYLGARNLKFSLSPASPLRKHPPAWVLAGEIVETTRVYGRHLAAIEPRWAAEELPHLIKCEYSEPQWHRRRGQVVAYRASRLYGLTLLRRERVDYKLIEPLLARDIFIAALAAGELDPDRRLAAQALFWQHNIDLIERMVVLEEKARRRDLLLDELQLAAFYRRHLPAEVVDRASLSTWLKDVGEEGQRALFLAPEDVLLKPDQVFHEAQFPDTMVWSSETISLRYCFSPGEGRDGLTAILPLSAMVDLPLYSADWLVPGMLRDKCLDMLKALPKSQRKQLLPLSRSVDVLLAGLDAEQCRQSNMPLAEALAAGLQRHFALRVDVADWRRQAEQSLDDYHRMRFEIYADDGELLAEGRDLLVLSARCAGLLQRQISRNADSDYRQSDLKDWSFGVLDSSQRIERGGFPALVDAGDSVSLDILSSAASAHCATRDGVLRLLVLAMKDKLRYLRKHSFRDARVLLPLVKIAPREQLIDDLMRAAVANSCLEDFSLPLPCDSESFSAALARGRGGVISAASDIEQLVEGSLAQYAQIGAQLTERRRHFPAACEDIDRQLAGLIAAGFIARMGFSRLQHLPRYLQAIDIRLQGLSGAAAKDNELCEKLASLEQPLKNLLYKYPEALFFDPAVADYRWLLEELRVSLFAQQLKTVQPVSLQRVAKAWNNINHNHYPMLD